jgi:PIN domain nuclease of toxin-antitoxin system
VRLLLDTHTALWYLARDKRLSKDAGKLVLDAANELLLSAAVVWEVSVKRASGKLDAPHDFVDRMRRAGAQPLSMTIEHAEASAQLPWHHRDPFDRILIAQARAEGATLVSADPTLRAYDVRTAW